MPYHRWVPGTWLFIRLSRSGLGRDVAMTGTGCAGTEDNVLDKSYASKARWMASQIRRILDNQGTTGLSRKNERDTWNASCMTMFLACKAFGGIAHAFVDDTNFMPVFCLNEC
jgi:hypothetical protein